MPLPFDHTTLTRGEYNALRIYAALEQAYPPQPKPGWITAAECVRRYDEWRWRRAR